MRPNCNPAKDHLADNHDNVPHVSVLHVSHIKTSHVLAAIHSHIITAVKSEPLTGNWAVICSLLCITKVLADFIDQRESDLVTAMFSK